MIIDKFIDYICSFSPVQLILFVTLFVLCGSVPIVYVIAAIAGVEYVSFLLFISIVLPLILTPVTLLILIRLTRKLSYFKKDLAREIEKNKAKDILLFEQARFALMGEMLANISHQWKQPLNTISLAVVNLKFSDQDRETQEKSYETIEKNVNYLASTINDFMSFFDRRDKDKNKPLQSIVQEVFSIIEANVKSKNISLEVVLEEQDKDIEIASSISQVLINLINNARDALSLADSKRIQLVFTLKRNGLEICCSDSGSGVAPEIQEQIFDPYFTTKEKSLGTGIGLYMSKQIVTKIFDGTITVVTPREDGFVTSFVIFLPYSDKCKKRRAVYDTKH